MGRRAWKMQVNATWFFLPSYQMVPESHNKCVVVKQVIQDQLASWYHSLFLRTRGPILIAKASIFFRMAVVVWLPEGIDGYSARISH